MKTKKKEMTVALSFLDLAEEDSFLCVYIFQSGQVTNPAQLNLRQDGLYAGQVGFREHFFTDT